MAAAVVGCLTGCAGSNGSSSSPSADVTGRQHPVPVKTVVRNYPVYRAGQAGAVSSPGQHAALRIMVSRPAVSTTSLSRGYGYSPRYGHYVSFRLTIRNTGKVPVTVGPLDFWVRTRGAARTTTDDGNAPYSGSSRQLDSTVLAVGHQVRNELTFDVADPSGTLFYGSRGSRAIGWSF